MNIMILSGAAALALAGATGATAQPNQNGQYGQTQYGQAQYSQHGGWDRDSFWRDAPRDPRDRIGFMQQRIDRGVSNGSLDRREARRSQRELDSIKRDARRMGRLDDRERDILQARLDDLGQKLRWRRQGQNVAYDNGGYRGADDQRFTTTYDASRYYRDDARYTERRLGAQDEVYRGSDGRYYCKRNDGTTGLIVGAIGGAVLGNVIDGGRQRAAGTLIGGALGALAGKAIDQNSDVRCK